MDITFEKMLDDVYNFSVEEITSVIESEKKDENISSSINKSSCIPFRVPGAAPHETHAPSKSITKESALVPSCLSLISPELTIKPPPCPSKAALTGPNLDIKAGTKSESLDSNNLIKDNLLRRSSSSGS